MGAREDWKSTSPPPKAGDHPSHKSIDLAEASADSRALDRAKQREQADSDSDASDTQHMKSNKALQDAKRKVASNDAGLLNESRNDPGRFRFKGSKN